ncbi:type II secretion system protein [Candidatus Dojkabacteria bacterium]|uniref:Type II secretion system protein n=1 Tax=Candidatus Dojkabacteria bacterium TaxID=2099670 RepID=A0A3M0Z2K4_9BACT|nr:MAG: type II secretion system protein [Candidatus Dojkabacteria bacterium]
MIKTNSTKKAFTLIELLVGMGIVSVLVGMSLLGINIVQQSTRNTQRRDILNSLNIALNAIYTSTNVYPTSLVYTRGPANGQDTITLSPSQVIRLSPPLKIGTSNTTPTNPSNTNYCYSSTGAIYTIGVQLEDGSWHFITNSSTPASTATCSDSGL